jgi:hypothetical protein
MTVNDFKDLSAGLQSIAIVIATFLGGGWALFQFFSLRALDKAKLALDTAKLELQKAKRELVEQGVMVSDLVCESFEIDGSYFLHVRVLLRNIGSGLDIVDWSKAQMYATRFEKVDGTKLRNTDEVLLAWRSPSTSIREMRFIPGFSSSDSFLIAIPRIGVYYVAFSVPVSPAVSTDASNDFTKHGVQLNDGDVIVWRADTFVAVPQVRPNGALQPTH